MIRSVGLAVAVPVILSVGLAGYYLEMVSSIVVFPEFNCDTFCWLGRSIIGDGFKHRRLSWMYL